MSRTSLPPGFRFHPTDVELIKFYLKRKVMGKRIRFEVISELDVYKYCPWDLPEKSCLRSKDLEWYFFSPRERKYLNGARMNRFTNHGYWKTTGKDRSIYANDLSVGMIKTLIFHNGKPPRGERTDWVMHEYRLEDKALADAGIAQDAYVICKIFQKSGPGPKNGAHYGAPFDEEEWSDNEVDCVRSFVLTELSAPPPTLKNNQNNSAATSTFIPGSTICTGSSSGTTLSHYIQCPDNMTLTFPKDDVSIPDIPFPLHDDIIHPLKDCLSDHITVAHVCLEQNENLDKVNYGDLNGNASLDVNSLFEDLGELGELGNLAQYSMSGGDKNWLAKNQIFGCEDFFNLEDLESPLEGPSNINGVKCFTADTGPLDYDFYNSSERQCFYLEDFESPLEGPSNINRLKYITAHIGPPSYTDPWFSISNVQSAFVQDGPDGTYRYENDGQLDDT